MSGSTSIRTASAIRKSRHCGYERISWTRRSTLSPRRSIGRERITAWIDRDPDVVVPSMGQRGRLSQLVLRFGDFGFTAWSRSVQLGGLVLGRAASSTAIRCASASRQLRHHRSIVSRKPRNDRFGRAIREYEQRLYGLRGDAAPPLGRASSAPSCSHRSIFQRDGAAVRREWSTDLPHHRPGAAHATSCMSGRPRIFTTRTTSRRRTTGFEEWRDYLLARPTACRRLGVAGKRDRYAARDVRALARKWARKKTYLSPAPAAADSAGPAAARRARNGRGR